MAAVLIAVIIVVGLIALVDLVLTFGLIRRVNSIRHRAEQAEPCRGSQLPTSPRSP
jgi:hypothetical protein